MSHCFGINVFTEWSDRLGNPDPGLADYVCAHETENGSGSLMLEADFLERVLRGKGSRRNYLEDWEGLEAFLC